MDADILKIAEKIQKYGDLAFLQGYYAAMQGIDINDRAKLAKMSEAYKRYMCFDASVKAIEKAKDKWIKRSIKPVNGKMSYLRTK